MNKSMKVGVFPPPWRWRTRLAVVAGSFALCALSFPLLRSAEAPADPKTAILEQLRLLNQVPEEQLSDKVDPAFSILRALYDEDGPEFVALRKLLWRTDVRAGLNPSARCMLAGLISERWDAFNLVGNLYLSGLRSANAELRKKASQKLIAYIQPAHIPALIDLLKVPGPFEILQEVSGQKLDPTMQAWSRWGKQSGGKPDLVGHLLGIAKTQLLNRTLSAFDQERFWYLPSGIRDAETPYAKRSQSEQALISQWNNWVNTEVKYYVDEISAAKPVLDRVMHQPDPRVTKFLEGLVSNPGFGDLASVRLAWRGSKESLEVIQEAYKERPTVGRALARGTLGDKTALADLLRVIERHQSNPFSLKIMDDDGRNLLQSLRTVGVVSAEQAFELLSHTSFQFEGAMTSREKKKAFKKAMRWLKENSPRLELDPRRGFYAAAHPAS
jgi:hypothetical protein